MDPGPECELECSSFFVRIGLPLTFKKSEDQTQSVGGMRKEALDAFMKPLKQDMDQTAAKINANHAAAADSHIFPLTYHTAISLQRELVIPSLAWFLGITADHETLDSLSLEPIVN